MADQENQQDNPEQESSSGTSESNPTARFETLKVFLKDASFESPMTPEVFGRKSVDPKFESQLGLDINSVQKDQGIFEVVLKITVTAQIESETLFLAEVQQGGIFRIVHPEMDKRSMVMEVTCPHILLPFAREELNSMITKGGFSPFLVAPVNFESLYRSKPETDSDGNPKPVVIN